jgi:hypothetical protein
MRPMEKLDDGLELDADKTSRGIEVQFDRDGERCAVIRHRHALEGVLTPGGEAYDRVAKAKLGELERAPVKLA